MTAAALIDALLDRAVVLAVVDGAVEVDAPVGVLTPKLEQAILAREAEVVHILTTMYNGRAVPPSALRPPRPRRKRHTVNGYSEKVFTARLYDDNKLNSAVEVDGKLMYDKWRVPTLPDAEAMKEAA